MKSQGRSVSVVMCVGALALAAGSGMAQQVESLGAKALFYNAGGQLTGVATSDPKGAVAPAQGAAAKASDAQKVGATKQATRPLALRATVLLISEGGGTREVKPSYRFKSNDRIKLAFTSSKAGYFYLAAIGSSGRAQVLSPRGGEAAVLEAGYQYVFPTAPNAFFRFDSTRGKEELWAVLTDEPLKAINMGPGVVAEISTGNANERTNVAYASKSTVDVTDELGRKDLVFEDDASAVYVAAKPLVHQAADTKKPPIVVKLTLAHD